MAEDARALLDHLGIERADVMGYSMGARVAAWLGLAAPDRVRSLVLGGLGIHLVEGAGLPTSIADAMEAPERRQPDRSDPAHVPPLRRSRRKRPCRPGGLHPGLAPDACRRQRLPAIACPALVAVGTKDAVAGDPHRLAALLPQGRALDIPGRDHNPAVGDKVFKAGVLSFLDGRP